MVQACKNQKNSDVIQKKDALGFKNQEPANALVKENSFIDELLKEFSHDSEHNIRSEVFDHLSALARSSD
ncbi:MAG: hypothetical protein M1331_02250 [Candidatus Marsarchaeota archaeon]|nr:hypothetical protein [Candidatus Marsarchaeota archaeon]MCL5106194.1 hypothetical protein [Candidatus Marsarchaeota archaeon]